MDTCICMAESLCCSSETITTLLIGYIPKQNVFGVKIQINLKSYIQKKKKTLKMVPIKNKERKKPSRSPNASSALTSQQQPPASCLWCLVGPRILCFLPYDCVTYPRAWIPASDIFQQGSKLPHSSKSLNSIFMATV